MKTRPALRPHFAELNGDRAAPTSMIGLGLAVPALRQSQAEVAEQLAIQWNLHGDELDRWQRINAGCAIQHRHAVAPIHATIGLSTAERMQQYERHAPALARDAAERALLAAQVNPSAITDLIVVSCTGFSAPGVDIALLRLLGLSTTVHRTVIGFMGCFGAITGLRAARAACAANPDAVALLVCVELCSLHLRPQTDPHNLIASALFADGAAAVVVCGSKHMREGNLAARRPAGASLRSEDATHLPMTIPLRLTMQQSHSLLLPQGEQWMTWRITDHGFAMTITKDVPVALRRCIHAFLADAAPALHTPIILHPGGAAILDAVEQALLADSPAGDVSALAASRRVLGEFGNMSSPSVLFVLARAVSQPEPVGFPALLLAFGPGLSIESVVVSHC